jgi:hypothetical protein
MERTLPIHCPSCRAPLRAKRFECPSCKTVVEGDFVLPVLGRLNGDEQLFVQRLITCSGSLKDLAKSYGVSYPTVRNRLDELIERIQALEAERPAEAQEGEAL